MLDAITGGLSGLVAGFANLHWSNPIMMVVGCVLLYLGIKKDFEPLLLVPIGFGAILVNIPLTGLMEEGGFLRVIYDAGVLTEVFPLLIFVGIGAMTDFGPLLDLSNAGLSPGVGIYTEGGRLDWNHRCL
jgi:Na+-transporting methylmalonyl-CoA/oxaloacetate decarboxylase beta subunit